MRIRSKNKGKGREGKYDEEKHIKREIRILKEKNGEGNLYCCREGDETEGTTNTRI